MIRINHLFVLFFVCNVSNAAINPMNYPSPVRQKLIEIKESCLDIADPTNKRPVYLEDHVVQKADLNGDGIQDFIVHESNEAYGGRHCGSVFGNSNGSIYIAVSGKDGLFKEAYYGHKGRQGEIHIDYRSKPNKITMELDNVFGSEQCGKDIKSNASATICNRTLLWNPVTKRLDLGPITFTPQQRRINSSNDLEFQRSQQRSRTSATVNNFDPQSDADYRNTGIPYQYRELSEPTDSLLGKLSKWSDQYDSVEKFAALGKISDQTKKERIEKFLRVRDVPSLFQHVKEETLEEVFRRGSDVSSKFEYIKYDDGMNITLFEYRGDTPRAGILEIQNVASSDLIEKLTGFQIGQKMVDVRNKLGMPHMITRGKNPNERIYFYSSDIYTNKIDFSSAKMRMSDAAVADSYASDFHRAKEKRLVLLRQTPGLLLNNFSAVYDENFLNPLSYGEEYKFTPVSYVSFSFDENNLLKQMGFSLYTDLLYMPNIESSPDR